MTSMRAIVQDRYGPPDEVLHLREVQIPEPAADKGGNQDTVNSHNNRDRAWQCGNHYLEPIDREKDRTRWYRPRHSRIRSDEFASTRMQRIEPQPFGPTQPARHHPCCRNRQAEYLPRHRDSNNRQSLFCSVLRDCREHRPQANRRLEHQNHKRLQATSRSRRPQKGRRVSLDDPSVSGCCHSPGWHTKKGFRRVCRLAYSRIAYSNSRQCKETGATQLTGALRVRLLDNTEASPYASLRAWPTTIKSHQLQRNVTDQQNCFRLGARRIRLVRHGTGFGYFAFKAHELTHQVSSMTTDRMRLSIGPWPSPATRNGCPS